MTLALLDPEYKFTPDRDAVPFNPRIPMTIEQAQESIDRLKEAGQEIDRHTDQIVQEAWKLKQEVDGVPNWKLVAEILGMSSWEEICVRFFHSYRQDIERRLKRYDVVKDLRPKQTGGQLKGSHIDALIPVPKALRAEVLTKAWEIAPPNKFSKTGGKLVSAKTITEAARQVRVEEARLQSIAEATEEEPSAMDTFFGEPAAPPVKLEAPVMKPHNPDKIESKQRVASSPTTSIQDDVEDDPGTELPDEECDLFSELGYNTKLNRVEFITRRIKNPTQVCWLSEKQLNLLGFIHKPKE